MELTQEALKVVARVNAGEHPNDIEEAEKWSCADGFGYGIWDGGYINPADILEGDDLVAVQDAIKTLRPFKELWEQISIEF